MASVYSKIKQKPLLVAFTLMGIGLAIALALTTVAIDNAHEAIDINSESLNQICTLAENEHASEVRQLERNYEYLNAVPSSEIDSVLNQFIIRGLPELELKARQDRAPRYCDEPGKGVPEPDPVLPLKQDFSHLLIPNDPQDGPTGN